MSTGVLAQTPKPGSGAGKGTAVPRPAPGPDYLEIVDAKGARSQVSFAAIKQASTGPVSRFGTPFPFTPLAAVLKLAGISDAAQVRITGSGGNPKTNHQMFLGKGANFDLSEFGFIFNMLGRAVLTPRPGTRHAKTDNVPEWPQVVDVNSIAVVTK